MTRFLVGQARYSGYLVFCPWWASREQLGESKVLLNGFILAVVLPVGIFLAEKLSQFIFSHCKAKIDAARFGYQRAKKGAPMPDRKRPRGRPRGSGKDDSIMLMQIADLLTNEPTFKPTTAMRQVIDTASELDATPESLLRRLQVKWRQHGDDYLAKAAEARARQTAPMTADGSVGGRIGSGLGIRRATDRLPFAEELVLRTLEQALHFQRFQSATLQMEERLHRGLEAERRLQTMLDTIDPPALRRRRRDVEALNRAFRF